MNGIISIGSGKIGSETVQSVNARDIHSFLDVSKDFTSWMKTQVKRARLVEGRDFLKFTLKGELSATGQNRDEYHVTIEAGKHIAMISGTDKGFEVRDYFIECEKIAKATPLLPHDFKSALLMLVAAEEEKEAQQLLIEIQRPKVEALDRLVTAEVSLCITDAAKHLQVKPKSLFNLMSLQRWIYRRTGSAWIAYQNKLQQGLVEHKITTIERGDGSEKVTTQVRITAKGLGKLAIMVGEVCH